MKRCEAAPAAFEAVVPSMVRYVGYAGGQTVNGMLRLTSEAGGALTVSGVLTGLEPSTSGGWHVHAGASCTDAAGAGGHYYDGLGSDPWCSDCVKWYSDAKGVAVVSLTMKDFTLDPAGPRYVGGRTVVVHASGGTKVAGGGGEPVWLPRRGCGGASNIHQRELVAALTAGYIHPLRGLRQTRGACWTIRGTAADQLAAAPHGLGSPGAHGGENRK